MKKHLIFATALAALASCSSDDFVGESPNGVNGQIDGAISFNMNTPTVTRAAGSAAATSLNNNFVVYGYKTVSSSPQTVFDNYQVNYVTNTANTTESNSANWEYVSYKNLPNGVSTNVGVTAFSALTGSGQANAAAIDQSIKYWDFSATQYDFFAYSLGKGNDHDSDPATDPQYARASKLTNSTYTLQGSAAELGTCYISNKKTLTSLSTSTTEVDLEFLSFLSKVELKFYEIIPGYSVKTVKFYPSSDGASSTTPSLYAGSSVIPIGGKYTITFDENGKAQVALEASEPTPTTDTKIDFSATLTNYKGAEYKEDNSSAIYLGRESNDATSTNTITVLPNPGNTNALNLKMDFTLISRDGSAETINMTGATAIIPAAYAKWKPNYKYTYIFKISDNTNAQSSSITGLYPITLDAVVTDTQDGTQETITTVSNPSITTYAKGTMVTANNEYLTSANIYIIVDNGTTLTTSNAKLYTAEIDPGAAQGITEETVANAIERNTDGGYDFGTVLENGTTLTDYYTYDEETNTYSPASGTANGTTTYYKKVTASVKDANGKKLVVKAADGLSIIAQIEAADAPDGKVITVNGAKFTPTTPGTYVFEYTDGSSNKHYKVIKVVAAGGGGGARLAK